MQAKQGLKARINVYISYSSFIQQLFMSDRFQ
jgi:hypothetical protein